MTDELPTILALEGQRVTFTGTLASMTHAQAADLVAEHGGEATSHLSRQTTILIVGEEGWPLEADGRPSQKYRQAQEWHALGAEIRVLRESDWLKLLGLHDQNWNVHRLHTPAMLERMLNLPNSLIRRWERMGLITAAKRVCRLPYFDFQEVARLGNLSELLNSGVSREQLERSLAAIGELFPEAEQPRSLLSLLARGREVVLEDEHGLIEPVSRQRLLGFEGERNYDVEEQTESPPSLLFPFQQATGNGSALVTASEWFQRGCWLRDEDDAVAAIEAFRMALMLQPGDVETQFCLADALYQAGMTEAAIERCYAVVETDRNYVEAWGQIGSLHSQRAEYHAAIAAFRIALDLHPDYPDAHLQLAEALAVTGREEEAAKHWRAYLEFDDRGPWADLARQRLGMVEECAD